MGGEAQVFLGDLEFQHQIGRGHCSKEWMERLARLEVDRAVLYLQQNIRCKLSVQWHELAVGLRCAVSRLLMRVDEGTPHDNATVRRQRIGEKIGALGMAPAV